MTGTKVVHLLLARCATTEWDDSSRMQGRIDLPLSAAGRAQMEAALAALGPLTLTTVLCGPDEASIETAELIAEAGGCSVKKLDALAEMDVGLWEGMLASELEERYPRACKLWREDPAGVRAPEGESLQEVNERVVGTLVRTLEKSKKQGGIAVVLRPVALGLVRCWLNGAPTSELWTMVKDRPLLEWYEVSPERLREAPEPSPTQ